MLRYAVPCYAIGMLWVTQARGNERERERETETTREREREKTRKTNKEGGRGRWRKTEKFRESIGERDRERESERDREPQAKRTRRYESSFSLSLSSSAWRPLPFCRSRCFSRPYTLSFFIVIPSSPPSTSLPIRPRRLRGIAALPASGHRRPGATPSLQDGGGMHGRIECSGAGK